ncbi:unnamed protein product [Dibothriocephalus latus]|uniref:Aminotransferase class V domain-containing protein n=1 Tax=Dibothriocephalus latus TaxID=60516 RepID=A0A3P7LUQ8_DIBLA|nr:unnamed protein product [Dibothriocephalus latus]
MYGWESEKAVEVARAVCYLLICLNIPFKEVAELINADPKEIIFTSGATESNNLSIKGVSRFYRSTKRHIIASQILLNFLKEHKCVLDSCRAMESEGFKVTYLPVQKNGLVSPKELEKAIQPDTAIVSIMAVNNEIGVSQPIEELARICKAKKVFFHTDAAQAVGKIPIDVKKLNVRELTLFAS